MKSTKEIILDNLYQIGIRQVLTGNWSTDSINYSYKLLQEQCKNDGLEIPISEENHFALIRYRGYMLPVFVYFNLKDFILTKYFKDEYIKVLKEYVNKISITKENKNTYIKLVETIINEIYELSKYPMEKIIAYNFITKEKESFNNKNFADYTLYILKKDSADIKKRIINYIEKLNQNLDQNLKH